MRGSKTLVDKHISTNTHSDCGGIIIKGAN